MYVVGRARTTRRPARRPSPARAPARAPLPAASRIPAREASTSSTIAPTLCRLPAYPGPGLPRPTTRNGPSEGGSCAADGDAAGAPAVPAPPRVELSVRKMPSSCSAVVGGLLGRVHRLAAARVLWLGHDIALAGALLGLAGLLALDAGLGLGLGELGLQGLGGRGTQEADDERVGVGHQRRAAREREVPGGDALAGLAAGDVHLDAVRQIRGVGLDGDGVQLVVRDGVRSRLADDDDRHLDGGLLTAADEQQVDVLVGALDRVALHGLGEGQLLLAVEDDGQQGVGATVAQRRGELAGRQRQVDDVLAVPVQDGGDATLAAGAAGAALAELGAGLGVQAVVGHGGVLLGLRVLGAAGDRTQHTPKSTRTSITESDGPLPRRATRPIVRDRYPAPPKRLVTEPSSKTSLIARASR